MNIIRQHGEQAASRRTSRREKGLHTAECVVVNVHELDDGGAVVSLRSGDLAGVLTFNGREVWMERGQTVRLSVEPTPEG